MENEELHERDKYIRAATVMFCDTNEASKMSEEYKSIQFDDA